MDFKKTDTSFEQLELFQFNHQGVDNMMGPHTMDILQQCPELTITAGSTSDYIYTTTNNTSLGTLGPSMLPPSILPAPPTVWSTVNPVTITNSNDSGHIQLHGKNADIMINGRSVMQILDKIEERLGILHPNHELEEKWHQLKELGEQYRKLEAEFTEKQKAWDTLRQKG